MEQDLELSSRATATKLPLQQHFAELNGLKMHYSTAGSGEVLILVSPGWGVGSTYLQRSFLNLAENFQLVFLDTRGSGGSARPTDPAEMGTQTMAEDLEALRLHLGVPKVNLLGHSNSGAIAITYAARYPERVERLAVIGSQVLGLSGAAETQALLQRRSNDPRFAAAVQAVAQFFSGASDPSSTDETLEAFIAQVLPLYLHAPEKTLAEAVQKLSGPISSFAFRAQNRADRAFLPDQTASLTYIRARTWIAVGRDDFICPVRISEQLHERVAGSSLVVFEESGHFPWIEEPDAFFPLLQQFLMN